MFFFSDPTRADQSLCALLLDLYAHLVEAALLTEIDTRASQKQLARSNKRSSGPWPYAFCAQRNWRSDRRPYSKQALESNVGVIRQASQHMAHFYHRPPYFRDAPEPRPLFFTLFFFLRWPRPARLPAHPALTEGMEIEMYIVNNGRCL